MRVDKHLISTQGERDVIVYHVPFLVDLVSSDSSCHNYSGSEGKKDDWNVLDNFTNIMADRVITVYFDDTGSKWWYEVENSGGASLTDF